LFLTDRLEAIVRERKAFDRAKRRASARLREGVDLQWMPPRSRDELHKRQVHTRIAERLA
jgi:hypothetical protein